MYTQFITRQPKYYAIRVYQESQQHFHRKDNIIYFKEDTKDLEDKIIELINEGWEIDNIQYLSRTEWEMITENQTVFVKENPT